MVFRKKEMAKSDPIPKRSFDTAASKGKKKMSDGELYGLIQKQAYELYLQRGRTHGNDRNDWFKAEKLVRQKYGL